MERDVMIKITKEETCITLDNKVTYRSRCIADMEDALKEELSPGDVEELVGILLSFIRQRRKLSKLLAKEK